MHPDVMTENRTRRSTVGPAWWAAVLSALAAAGLVALDVVLLLMDALATGAIAVLDPESEDLSPTSADYAEAGVLGSTVALVGSQVLVLLGARTAVTRWPPVLQGLAATLLASVLGTVALLLRLGIDPLEFAVAWI